MGGTDVELGPSLHHLQDDVAADGVAQQHQAGVGGDVSPEEGQLVLNLPVQTKDVALRWPGGVWPGEERAERITGDDGDTGGTLPCQPAAELLTQGHAEAVRPRSMQHFVNVEMENTRRKK